MSSTDFARAEELFAAALALPPGERDAYLREACGADTRLLRRVEQLLARDAQPDDVFGVDAADLAAQVVAADAAGGRSLPERIGAYRVRERLGEGGMGIVYLAEQDQPRRRVAIKVLQAASTTPSRLRRFTLEMQLLGTLDHPGIAKIHEAGTHDFGDGARPFFAMEFVDGEPITTFAAAAHVSLTDRVRLMINVCGAVHHAHQRGVIHRDLKPANILAIAGAGWRCKILDFGIARVVSGDLADSTMHTQVGQLVGTLPYMSPEQVAGDAAGVDVRSDVYALGVVFFEMLTGRLPYDVKDKPLPTVARTITEADPDALSSVDRSLRGDLEQIVRKTLEKDRIDRYQSAAQLAEDLQRYLDDEPIVARPPSAPYQIRKFARRNRGLVAGAIALLVVLAASSIVSTSLFVSARREAAEADWQSYVATIAAADAAIREGAAEDARSRLDAAPPRLRGWEWWYLDGLLDRWTGMLTASENVKAIAFTHDEGRIVIGDDEGGLTVFDAETGTELSREAGAHTGWLHDLRRHPEQDLFASAGHDGVVRLWTIDAADELVAGPHVGEWPREIFSIAWSPNGETLFVGARGEIVEMAPFEPRRVRRFEHAPFASASRVTVSADGRRLIAANSTAAVRSWDLETGVEREPLATAPDMIVGPVVVFDDGRRVVLGTQVGDVRVRDLETGESLASFRAHAGPVIAMALSPDESLLATGGVDSRVRLWDTADSHLVADLVGHNTGVTRLTFNGDGSLLVSGSNDDTARIWSLDANCLDRLPGYGWVHAVDLFDEGREIVFASDKVYARSLDGRRSPARSWEASSAAVCAVAHGEHVLFLREPNWLSRWNRTTGETDDVAVPDAPSGLAVAPDESWAAVTAHRTPRIHVIDLNRFQLIDTLDPTVPSDGNERYGLECLAIHPSRSLIAAGHGPFLTMWDRTSGSHVTRDLAELPADGVEHADEDEVGALAFGPDGRTLAAGTGGRVLILDVDTLEPVATLSSGAADHYCEALAYSADGRRFFAGDSRGSLRLWDVPSFRHVATLRLHFQQINGIDLSEDDSTLVTASGDLTLRVLRAEREWRLRAK